MNKRHLVGFDTALWFGKYKGRKVSDLFDDDPQYLEWAFDKRIIDMAAKDLYLLRKELRDQPEPDGPDIGDTPWG